MTSAVDSTTAAAGSWQTKAFHSYARRTFKGSEVCGVGFCVEASDCALRITTATAPETQCNVGISWSDTRNMYVFGIKTKSGGGPQPFPPAKIVIPAFLALLHALGIHDVFLYDQASVTCRCGVAVPSVSVVRLLAGQGTLYELFSGHFKNPSGVAEIKRRLHDDVLDSDRDVCRRFLTARDTSPLLSPCLHAHVNAVVTKVLAMLKAASLQNSAGVFAYQEYTLVTA